MSVRYPSVCGAQPEGAARGRLSLAAPSGYHTHRECFIEMARERQRVPKD